MFCVENWYHIEASNEIWCNVDTKADLKVLLLYDFFARPILIWPTENLEGCQCRFARSVDDIVNEHINEEISAMKVSCYQIVPR